MKYLLMFGGTEEDQLAYLKLSDAERGRRGANVGRWFAGHGAKIVASERLHPPETATTVRFQPDGQTVVTDGPFIEGKETIGGFAVIDVDDLDEAMRMAREWPGSSMLEIRPIL